MTTKIGEEVKSKRLKRGLTQKELAENICTQATISNLENGASVPTISILLKLAERLNIEFNSIYDYALDAEHKNNPVFKEVRELCSKVRHKEAFELLESSIKKEELETIYDWKLYYYFMGITSLMGKESPTDAIYYFNQVLDSEIERSIDFLHVSATNGIGIAYDLQNEYDKALTYFERSLEQLDELFTLIDTINESPEIAKIYYNTAKFYSKIGDYSKSMNLCNLGIRLLKNEGLAYYVDFLTYEKAFNLMKLGKKDEAIKSYLHALAFADFNGNQVIVDIIKKDAVGFDIGKVINSL